MSDECRRYIEDIDVIEDRIVDDAKFPIIKNSKVKNCCRYSLEILKLVVDYVGLYINAKKAKCKHTYIKSGFERISNSKIFKYFNI